MSSKVTIEDVNEFFLEAFPKRETNRSNVIEVEKGRAVMKLSVTTANGRPGGYISGPTQMAMADSSAYAAVFTELGIVPMAVTSNLNIDFLRPCIGTGVLADARVIKLGRTLAVINVEIRAEGEQRLSSQATVTYSLPQK